MNKLFLSRFGSMNNFEIYVASPLYDGSFRFLLFWKIWKKCHVIH